MEDEGLEWDDYAWDEKALMFLDFANSEGKKLFRNLRP